MNDNERPLYYAECVSDSDHLAEVDRLSAQWWARQHETLPELPPYADEIEKHREHYPNFRLDEPK